MKNALVITTINPPRKEVVAFSKLSDWNVICVGDKKSPKKWHANNVTYLSVIDQEKLFPQFSKLLPWNVYGRKNIGYLFAIKNKFPLIGETDDDVLPYENFPPLLNKNGKAVLLHGAKFLNIYKRFNKGNSWPRGLPLDSIKNEGIIKKNNADVYSPIQNSVIDCDSDFDAIYRLTSNKPVKFYKRGKFALEKGAYSPVNSQNTFFYPEAYALLYMPSYVNPRVEDILRGYIAQRILWEINGRITFNYTTAYTKNRNFHNYLNDFKNELPLYLETKKIIDLLDSLSLFSDINRSLIKVYSELAKAKFVRKEESRLAKAWVKEVEKYS
jgi:hypothetical protein